MNHELKLPRVVVLVGVIISGLTIYPIPALGQSGRISTIAGPPRPLSGISPLDAAIDNPKGLALDGLGGFYVASSFQNRIYHVTSAGVLTVVAGNSYGFAGDGGLAAFAKLADPAALAVDSAGNLYISDKGNNRVRRIDRNGVITTVAGTGEQGFSGDGGPAIAAMLSGPEGLTVDSAGNLYVADSGNGRVRRIAPNGLITTPAGSQLGTTRDVAVDDGGNLYVTTPSYLYRVLPNGAAAQLTFRRFEVVFRGGQVCRFEGDGGPVSAASVCTPNAVAVDRTGNIYVSDGIRVRRIDTQDIITTVAGGGGETGDGGPAAQAQLTSALRIAVNNSGELFVAEAGSKVRKVAGDGTIHTVSGRALYGFSGDGHLAVGALLDRPLGVALDSRGSLYVADWNNRRVRTVNPAGTITTVAGNGVSGYSGDGGPATAAQIQPGNVAVNQQGNLFIVDAALRVVAGDGVIRTFQPQLAGGFAMTFDGAGNLYAAVDGPHVVRVDRNGQITTIAGTNRGFSGDGGAATAAQLESVAGLAVDQTGNLYISDSGNSRIRKVSVDGIISTIAGDGTFSFGGDGGPSVKSRLAYPRGIAVDGLGNLYLADQGNNRVRKISTDGTITTVAGNGVPGFSGDGGPPADAQLNYPIAVAIDSSGNLYIAEELGNRIRKVAFSEPRQTFSIPVSGAVHLTTSATPGEMTTAYARILANPGLPTPRGISVFSYRSNGILVSETSVEATRLSREGRTYAETTDRTRTGVAIANPVDTPASISYYFTDKNGIDSPGGSFTLPPQAQIARFFDEPPFSGDAQARSFTYNSSVPVGVIALHGTINERNEFLMTTLPVASTLTSSGNSIVLPHYAAGAGWSTKVLLVNPTNSVLKGAVEMDAIYTYTIEPRSAVKVSSTATGDSVRTGNVRIMPSPGSPTPVVSTVFTLVKDGTTVTENGVATNGVAQGFRLFAEIDPSKSLRTGIAIANTSPASGTLQFELLDMNGQPTGRRGSTTIEGAGHLARFLDELLGLAGGPLPFTGILRVSSTVPITAFGLREQYNERGDFLIATTPAMAENQTAAADEYVFAHVVTGAGYTTEFILMNPDTLPLPGDLRFVSPDGLEIFPHFLP